MPHSLSSNLTHLFEAGVSIETSLDGNWPSHKYGYNYDIGYRLGVRVGRLRLLAAVQLAHVLTVKLDETMDTNSKSINTRLKYSPQRFTLGNSIAEAEGIRERHNLVFGSTKPAEGNFSVRVERGFEEFILLAGFKDRNVGEPEYETEKLLQLGFVATLETVNL